MTTKNTLVIGGSSGIGLAIVQRLCETGHNVWAIARKQGEELSGLDCTFLECDVTTQSLPVDKLPESLDGLVYCPGTIRLKGFRALKNEDFLADFNLNVLGAVNSIRSVLPRLKHAENASIVLFSTVAVQTGMAFHASIASAKGAVEGLTRSLAAEFAPRIRVNAIAPSLTDTPLASKLLNREDSRKAAADRHPLKRVGQPEDIAAAATYLLSDDSSWMTGQVMALDGGMSAIKEF